MGKETEGLGMRSCRFRHLMMLSMSVNLFCRFRLANLRNSRLCLAFSFLTLRSSAGFAVADSAS